MLGDLERAAIVSLGDQVQALCQGSPVEMAAFILFAADGTTEYRSPHDRETVIFHLRQAADELEQDVEVESQGSRTQPPERDIVDSDGHDHQEGTTAS